MLQKFLLCLGVLSTFCFTNLSSFCEQCECGKTILEGKIPVDHGRYSTFVYALSLLCQREAKTIVETGTARAGLTLCLSDGCSTAIFGEWVKKNGGECYSVDNNLQNLQTAAYGIGDASNFVHFVHSDSIAFLKNFNRSIDFLYLDSYDYDFNNPQPSQDHHLKEIIAAYPWLHSKSFILIDDCALPGGGKGKLVIEYLLARGWKIIAANYQVLLSQE